MADAGDDKKNVKQGIRLELDPQLEVSTAIGPIFVSDTGWSSTAQYAKQLKGDSLSQVRRYLAETSSKVKRTSASEKLQSLGPEDVADLSDDDVECMAAAYLTMLNAAHYVRKARESKPTLAREKGESSVAFLDRLLRWQADYRASELKALADRVTGSGGLQDELAKSAETHPLKRLDELSPFTKILQEEERTRRLFDQHFGGASQMLRDLNSHAAGLADFVEEERKRREAIRKLAIPMPESANLEPPPLSATLERVEQTVARREEERQEELAVTRDIGEMTRRSAELLAELSKVSVSMLEKFGAFLADFRDGAKRSDKSSRTAIWIAAGSLVLTVVISSVALWFAVASYKQDAQDIASDDKWQAAVTDLLKSQGAANEKSRQELATENERLRQRIEALEKAVSASKPTSRLSR